MPKDNSQARRRQAAALVAKIVACAVADEQSHSSVDETRHTRHRDPHYPYYRRRRTVREVYRMIGDTYFRRAYRMNYQSFLRLHEKLSTGILVTLLWLKESCCLLWFVRRKSRARLRMDTQETIIVQAIKDEDTDVHLQQST